MLVSFVNIFARIVLAGIYALASQACGVASGYCRFCGAVENALIYLSDPYRSLPDRLSVA